MTDQTPHDASQRMAAADERDAVKTASTPTTAAAGAVAGTTAGLITGGPFGAGIGAIVGAIGGATIGAAGAQAAEGTYTEEYDTHYRALWEGSLDHPADRTFDQARPAYQLGHIAAYQPEFAGRDFTAAKPMLRRAWSDDFRARYGEWDAVRGYVRDAYGHARSEGAGVRRGGTAIGTGGSAVDPVELERARSGLPSRDDEQSDSAVSPTERAAASTRSNPTAPPDEITANEAHRDRLARG